MANNMIPVRVCLSSGKPYDVYCGRAGHGHDGTFGNPFSTRLPPSDPFHAVNKTDAIAKFKQWATRRFNTDPHYQALVMSLVGKRIACFCPVDKPCHTDVYVELIASKIDMFGGLKW